jgi:hypothetical protein
MKSVFVIVMSACIFDYVLNELGVVLYVRTYIFTK